MLEVFYCPHTQLANSSFLFRNQDKMSSENFENLDEDFITLKERITSKIEDQLPKSSGQARKNLTRDIQRDLDDAQRLLQELEIEARAAPYSFRLIMNTRLKTYRQDINTLKKKVVQNENNFAASSRNQLLGTTSQSSSMPSSSVASNRGRLLQINDTIDRTTQSVNRTQQIAAETDQVGIAVVDELGTQREALIRTKERLVDTDSNLTKSRKILRSMYRRVMTNKLILIVIIILEIAILCGIVYYRFIR
ncbi:vesicle transport through interaction with t-SNAREs homolog 1B [Trichonephila inaurata madagascariensis]|uniref:Vesicle transport through interaction with t-SNAREs homolog 1B n=1 Tax=Trichonephila inaurata madagascariensis TaxID=2747483 RepID=A0A8X6WRH7_9ARAC|nr:vesicle transport through interaction with t-SNAREs homolog 1B [Trichonephila inaurata madagascariensis]